MSLLDFGDPDNLKRRRASLTDTPFGSEDRSAGRGFFGRDAKGKKPPFLDTVLAPYKKSAYEGQDEEERRGFEQEQYLRGAEATADKPTITQEEIDRQFGRSANTTGRTFLDSMSALREYMGSSGVYGGGLPTGIAANFELSRLGQLTQARGDQMSFKATSDALDRQRKFDRQGLVSASIGRPISMLGIDFENQAAQFALAKYGIDKQAKAAKDAAKSSTFGDILGGVGSIAGLFL